MEKSGIGIKPVRPKNSKRLVTGAIIHRKSLQETIKAKTVTYDPVRQIDGATEISCSAFGDVMVVKV